MLGVLHRPAVGHLAVRPAGRPGSPGPASSASCSVSPTAAICGSEKTACGTNRWSVATMASGCSRLCCTVRASSLATCLSGKWVQTSPRAKTPSAVVRWYSSTTIRPWSSVSMPALSRFSVSPLGIRPVATSSVSASSVGRPARSVQVQQDAAVVARLHPGRLRSLAGRRPRRPNCSVNRAAISSSSRRSSRSERLTTVTAVPNAEKTWANSAAT